MDTLTSPIEYVEMDPPETTFPDGVLHLCLLNGESLLADLCTPIHDQLRSQQ